MAVISAIGIFSKQQATSNKQHTIYPQIIIPGSVPTNDIARPCRAKRKTHQLTLRGAIPRGGTKFNKAPPVKARASLIKRGRKLGEKVHAKMKVADWYAACETFRL